MKIGILTFPNSTSYGAVLQMSALYNYLKKQNCEVEIINYCNLFMQKEQHYKKNKWSVMIKKLLHLKLYEKFKSYEKNELELFPQKKLESHEELIELSKRYDTVICGSDQVWNPDITGNDLSYFLDFCGEKVNRVSYAPSFGVTELEASFQEKMSKELEKFFLVSIREKEGQDMLKQIMNKEYPIVLDPTFLLSKEEWEEKEQKVYGIKNPYVVYYTVHSSEKLFRFAKKLAEEKGMDLLVIGGNFIKKFKNSDKKVNYCVDIGPKEWLYLMNHAEYVVTNSFHGTAFAINFHKEFYVEFSSFFNSRLENIIRLTGLENRVINNTVGLSKERIDYIKVNNKLADLMEESKAFLSKVISA